MFSKDFNILGLKVDSLNNKKDISFVTDINSYVQKIENICRLQKGEIPSSSSLGINYYSFIFDPISNKSVLQDNISSALKSSIKDIKVTSVSIIYYDDKKILMNVSFVPAFKIQKSSTTCKIEVELV